MPDSLKLFGMEYDNVTGIIITNDSGDELTYVKEASNTPASDVSIATININIMTSLNNSTISSIRVTSKIDFGKDDLNSYSGYNAYSIPVINNSCEILLYQGVGYIESILVNWYDEYNYLVSSYVDFLTAITTENITYNSDNNTLVVTGNGTITASITYDY